MFFMSSAAYYLISYWLLIEIKWLLVEIKREVCEAISGDKERSV